MYNGLVHAHSGLRYLIVLGFLWVIFQFLLSKQKGFEGTAKKGFLITLALCHVQLILGLILYFISPKSEVIMENFSMAMQNSLTRFYGLEHILGMLIAIALVTIGYSRAKRNADVLAAHKNAFRLYLVAFILIFVNIPWPFMRDFGTWF